MSPSTWMFIAAGVLFVLSGWVYEKFKSEKVGGWLSLAAIVLAFVGYRTMPESIPPKEPETIAELLGDKFKDHTPGNRELVMYKTGTLWSDASTPGDMAHTFDRIGRWLMKKPDERIKFEELWIRQWVPSQSIYGESGESVSLAVSWKAEDIRRIQWNKLIPEQLLELGTLQQLKPIVRAGVIKWCSEQAEMVPRFCRQVR